MRGPTTGQLHFAQFKCCRSGAAAAFSNKAWRAYGTESRVRTKIGKSELTDSKGWLFFLVNTMILGRK